MKKSIKNTIQILLKLKYLKKYLSTFYQILYNTEYNHYVNFNQKLLVLYNFYSKLVIGNYLELVIIKNKYIYIHKFFI